MNRRDEILGKVKAVKAMPASTVEAMNMLLDPDFNIRAVARAIEVDPGLTLNLLRIANSVFYAGTREISSVREALVRLGSNQVLELVTAAASAAQTIRRPVSGYDLEAGALWERSVAVAVGSRKIAKSLGLKAPRYTFTAALLHDIGKVVLGTFIEVDATAIIELVENEDISFVKAERTVLGVDHAEVGACLLESWKLPSCLVEVARWHHRPDKTPGDQLVVDLVNVADALTLLFGIGLGRDGLSYRPAEGSVQRLGINIHRTEEILAEIHIEISRMRDSLLAA